MLIVISFFALFLLLTSRAASENGAVATPQKSCKIDDSGEGSCFSGNGFILLEHVNLNIPTQAYVNEFYVNLLGLVADPRKTSLSTGTGTLWFNAGMTQIHLPKGEAQVIPGYIEFMHKDLDILRKRILDDELVKQFEGTQFSWSALPNGSLNIVGPYGNNFRVHQVPKELENGRKIGAHAHGNRADMMYINRVLFLCRPHTAVKIGRFYEKYFGCRFKSTLNANGSMKVAVEVGMYQDIVFQETTEQLPIYDGHHIAVYVKDVDTFSNAFQKLSDNRLIFINNRPRFGNADTLEKALEERQFRIKDIVDSDLSELLLELEHEIRTPDHKFSPIGKSGEEIE